MTWLDDLERLEREATRGPWVVVPRRSDDGDSWPAIRAADPALLSVNLADTYGDASAALIVALRNAAPHLVAIARAAAECLAATREEQRDSGLIWYTNLYYRQRLDDALAAAAKAMGGV